MGRITGLKNALDFGRKRWMGFWCSGFWQVATSSRAASGSANCPGLPSVFSGFTSLSKPLSITRRDRSTARGQITD